MLSHYTSKDLIILEPQISSKDELFEKMVNLLYNLDYIIDKKEFLNALKAREELSNTELIPEIALPHSRSNSVEKLFLSVVIIKNGLDYGSSDMGDAKIIFFFGTSPKQNKEYLQLLAKSARLLKLPEFKDALLKCTGPAEVIEVLNEFDSQEESSVQPKYRYMMLITLHMTHRLNDILTTLIELGITNASVIETTSLSNKLMVDIPVFSSLYYNSKKKKRESSLILCQIESPESAHQLVDILKGMKIDFNKKGTGFIQIIESELILGNPDEELDI